MKHRDFRKLQAELDQFGLATAINKNGKSYECIVNFEIKKSYKTRLSAKNYFVHLLDVQKKFKDVAEITATEWNNRTSS